MTAAVDILGGFLSPDNLINTGVVILTLVGIWIGVIIVMKFLDVFVERLFRSLEVTGETQRRRRLHVEARRANTMKALMKSVGRYAVYFVAGVMALDKLGFPTGSILAGAGIGGLAVGFGAQNLVRDVISGFFILFEDQFAVGDYVTVNGVSGIVEETALRVTKVRDFGGPLHVVPNGEITMVTNHMGERMRVMFDVGVSYSADVDEVIRVLEELFEEIKDDLPDALEGPQVLGVSALGDSSVSFSILAKAKTMTQWGLEREIRRRIKKRFDERGIEIPFPQRVLHIKQSPEKTVKTQPGETEA